MILVPDELICQNQLKSNGKLSRGWHKLTSTLSIKYREKKKTNAIIANLILLFMGEERDDLP